MAIPDSDLVLERLLNLFPASAIKDTEHAERPIKKAEAISSVVSDADASELSDFVTTHFGLLHQNVYLYSWDPPRGTSLDPNDVFGEPPIESQTMGSEQHYVYLLPRTYALVIEPPLERTQLTFAWPIKVVTTDGVIRIHFTLMSKRPSAYIDDSKTVITASPSPREEHLLQKFEATDGVVGHAHPMDLNKGVKSLWKADEIDSPKIKYKRAKATSRDNMDENYMVKKDDPNLYKSVLPKPLFNSQFRLTVDDPCTRYFTTDPKKGLVTFRIHSSTTDCVDRVVRRIVEAN